MSVGRRIASVVVAFTLACTVSTPAFAKSAPAKVTAFKIGAGSAANINARIPYTYSDVRLPAGGHLVLQRQVGTNHVWRTQVVLHGKSGHGSLAALPMGRYALRVAMFDKHNKGLASIKKTLSVYGPVQLAALCNQPQGNVEIDDIWFGGCRSTDVDTATIGGHTFTYFVGLRSSPTPASAITVQRSTCRSITVTFALDTEDEAATQVGTVTLSQSAADPVVGAAGIDQLVAFSSPLDGNSWSLTVATATPIRTGVSVIYVNADLSCYTADGA